MTYGEDYKRVRRMVSNVPKAEQPKVSNEVICDVGDDFKTVLRRIQTKGLDQSDKLIKEVLAGKVKGQELYGAVFLITRRGRSR
ncbi:MAG: hypothetical protein QXX51_01365 [Candidatus Bathyarchaeia archaeon]